MTLSAEPGSRHDAAMLRRLLPFVLVALTAALLPACDFVKPKTALAGFDRLPAFPEPPPDPAATLELPEGLITEPSPQPLKEVYDRLTQVLETAGFEKWLVYAYQDGFAMVARWEHFDENGGPAGDRFPARLPAMKRGGFEIDHHAQVLFNAAPGFYRLFVFLVAGGDGEPSGEVPIEGDEVDAGELPDELATQLARDRTVTAKVYVYRRRGSARAMPEPSELGAADHLVAAGLFTPAELGTR